MAGFTRRPLRWLDSIYRFIGGVEGLRDFSLASSIQPVHDLSREAERASEIGTEEGYFTLSATDTHVGSGSIRSTADPWAIVGAEEIRRQTSLWMINAWMTSNNGNVEEGGLSVSIRNDGSGTFQAASAELLTHHFDAVGPIVVSGNLSYVGTGGNRAAMIKLPLWLPDPVTVNRYTRAAAAGVSVLTILLWAGSKASAPPGMY